MDKRTRIMLQRLFSLEKRVLWNLKAERRRSCNVNIGGSAERYARATALADWSRREGPNGPVQSDRSEARANARPARRTVPLKTPSAPYPSFATLEKHPQSYWDRRGGSGMDRSTSNLVPFNDLRFVDLINQRRGWRIGEIGRFEA